MSGKNGPLDERVLRNLGEMRTEKTRSSETALLTNVDSAGPDQTEDEQSDLAMWYKYLLEGSFSLGTASIHVHCTVQIYMYMYMYMC